MNVKSCSKKLNGQVEFVICSIVSYKSKLTKKKAEGREGGSTWLSIKKKKGEFRMEALLSPEWSHLRHTATSPPLGHQVLDDCWPYANDPWHSGFPVTAEAPREGTAAMRKSWELPLFKVLFLSLLGVCQQWHRRHHPSQATPAGWRFFFCHLQVVWSPSQFLSFGEPVFPSLKQV